MSIVAKNKNELSRAISWIEFSTACYLALAGALLIFDWVGLTGQSGEAIVRVFTLSSVPAMFVILLGRSRYSNMWTYMFLINSLFFANTMIVHLSSN